MIQERNWYRRLMKIADIYNRIIDFICVVMLTAQTIAVLIMVFSRYVTKNTPQWTEQFALFCMIWFAMFSICLGARSDSHIKMDVIDTLVSPKALNYFKLLNHICTAVFGFVLFFYGIQLAELTWGTKLSAFRVPTGLQYLSAVVAGLFMILNAGICSIEMFAKVHDDNLAKEETEE